MTVSAIIGEILPVIGTIGLLGVWLYQQKEIDAHTNKLRNINSARNVYQTYQSNNAVFNAIIELAGNSKVDVNKIRAFQIYNYELGLSDIEKLFSKEEKKGLPSQKDIGEIMVNPEKAFDITQKRLESLYTKLDQKEENIMTLSKRSKSYYFWAYVIFSLISIAGAIFKILAK